MQQELKAAFDMLLSPDPKNTAVAIELLESSLFTAEQVEAYAQEHFWWVMQGNWWNGDKWQPFDTWKQLASLQWLGLYNTQITALSESIGQLASLQWLDLSNTKITSLSESIGQLASLQRLNLRNTKITSNDPLVVAMKKRGVQINF